MLVGSPPCTDFCTLNQNINHKKLDTKELARKMVRARVHLEFCAELYQWQLKEGRHFLHEHPLNATSWQHERMKQLMMRRRPENRVGPVPVRAGGDHGSLHRTAC